MTIKNPPTLLCILDGFGLNPNPKGNAVAQARKPNFDALWRDTPHTTLTTFGERVGLPAGQMGNSEVGHLNIGAGRVIEQWLLRVNRALQTTYLDNSKVYQAFKTTCADAPALHLIGLYSDGGVHSHSEHLELLVANLIKDFKQPIYLHLISDGRDTSPNQLAEKLPLLQAKIAAWPQVKIASITGRFFTMDRDNRWERVKKGYDAVVSGQGARVEDPLKAVLASYEKGITDEFLEPIICADAPFSPKDGAIFWNFRSDRMREIVNALCLSDFNEFPRPVTGLLPTQTLCFTEYDARFKLPVLFEQEAINNHLGEVVAKAGLRQLRVAETEKYPHVTYFLNGGIESEYPGEERSVCPSPKDVKTYDLKPEMSAYAVCQVVEQAIATDTYDLIVVNFANCDMVGHTGVLSAATKAVETVDICLGRILKLLEEKKGNAVIIADHGNAEQMIHYEDGSPHTSHTTYPVPCIVITPGQKITLREDGALCDVAPTVLALMKLNQPKEMKGVSLLQG